MKQIHHLALASSTLFFSFTVQSQNVGIGVAAPTQKLSIAKGLNIDHDNENTGADLLNGLRFGNTDVANQITGIASGRAASPRPFALDFYTNNTRRMTIMQNGLVGIGMVPTQFVLEVNGTVRAMTNLRSAGNVIADVDVVAQDDVAATNDITAGGNIGATGNISAGGRLAADGRGVLMNNGSSQMKYATFTATLSASSLASEASVVGTITFAAGTYTAPPTAYVGNVITPNGEYFKALLVLEDVTATGLKVRVVNPTPNPITFTNAVWRIVTIGPF